MTTRTLISLDDDDKAWLDEQARSRAQPMTQVVREAVAEYRVRAAAGAGESLADLLGATAGLFARRTAAPPDGLALQRRLRAEWGDGARADSPAGGRGARTATAPRAKARR